MRVLIIFSSEFRVRAQKIYPLWPPRVLEQFTLIQAFIKFDALSSRLTIQRRRTKTRVLQVKNVNVNIEIRSNQWNQFNKYRRNYFAELSRSFGNIIRNDF